MSGRTWKANAYTQFYDWDMYSNPTYANPDGSSAQIHQFDRRWIFGLRGDKTWRVSDALDLKLGTETRYDDIPNVGVQHTIARAFVSSFGLYKVKEASTALYGEATLRPLKGLRIIAGLRGDLYHYDVRANDAAAAALGEGSGDAHVVSPVAVGSGEQNSSGQIGDPMTRSGICSVGCHAPR